MCEEDVSRNYLYYYLPHSDMTRIGLLDISLKARFATLIYHHRILNAVLST